MAHRPTPLCNMHNLLLESAIGKRIERSRIIRATKNRKYYTYSMEESKHTTEELALKAKQGDRDAFAALYALCSNKLYSTALYMLGRREDAEDLVMETVTDAFRGISRLRDPALFEGWIFQILMNKIKRKRKSYLSESVELSEINSPNVSGPDETSVFVRQAMKKLKQEDQVILILSIVDGYQSDEIGKILGMTPNTVRSRQKRSLEKLKELMGEVSL